MTHDGEAQPGSAFVARSRRVDAIEALEDSSEVIGRNSDTGVAHAHVHAAVRPGSALTVIDPRAV